MITEQTREAVAKSEDELQSLAVRDDRIGAYAARILEVSGFTEEADL